MKKLVFSLCILALSIPAFSQTKKIAHLSHSGMGFYFLDEFDDNLGWSVEMELKYSTLDTVIKISDTSVVVIRKGPNYPAFHLQDTVYNPPHIDNEVLFVDSMKTNVNKKIVVQGFAPKNDSTKTNKSPGRPPSSNDHGPSDPGDRMMFPASPTDGPNVNGVMMLSLAISSAMALLTFLVFTNVRRKSNQLISITMENVK